MPTPAVGHRLKARRTRAEMGVRGLDIGKLSQISGASRWATSRAVNGHPVSVKTIQRIAEALAKVPPLAGIELQLEEV
jgi:hypothetical protein